MKKSLSGLRAIVSALLIASFAYAFALDVALVRGKSMEPGIRPGSVVMILRCAYGFRPAWADSYWLRWASPRRGDIVVLTRDLVGANGAVKRVFEVGPSFLKSESGFVYGSGGSAPLDAQSPLNGVREAYVPPDSVFVLGDNAADSYDSRHYGSVPVENIRGKVLFLRRRSAP